MDQVKSIGFFFAFQTPIYIVTFMRVLQVVWCSDIRNVKSNYPRLLHWTLQLLRTLYAHAKRHSPSPFPTVMILGAMPSKLPSKHGNYYFADANHTSFFTKTYNTFCELVFLYKSTSNKYTTDYMNLILDLSGIIIYYWVPLFSVLRE